MKKYLLLFVLLFLSSLTAVAAQTAGRANQSPGFFIPPNALKNSQGKRKLPPVESLRYKGQMPPIVIQRQAEAQRRLAEQQAEAERLREQQEREEIIRQSMLEHQKNSSDDTETLSRNSEINANSSAKPSAQDIIRRRLSKYLQQENSEDEDEEENSENNEEEEERQRAEKEYQKIEKERDAKFDKIITEYRSDILNLSENKPFHNQRLIDMIADYKDAEHKL